MKRKLKLEELSVDSFATVDDAREKKPGTVRGFGETGAWSCGGTSCDVANTCCQFTCGGLSCPITCQRTCPFSCPC